MEFYGYVALNSSPPKKPGNFAPHLLPLEGTHPASCLGARRMAPSLILMVFLLMSSILHPRNKFVVQICIYIYTYIHVLFLNKAKQLPQIFPKTQKNQQVGLQQPFSNSFCQMFVGSQDAESPPNVINGHHNFVSFHHGTGTMTTHGPCLVAGGLTCLIF